MGSNLAVCQKKSCVNNIVALCKFCKQCPKCSQRMRECTSCFQLNPYHVHLFLQFDYIKNLYENGVVKKVRPLIQRVQPSSGTRNRILCMIAVFRFYHCLLEIQVQVGNKIHKVILDGDRDSVGAVKIIMRKADLDNFQYLTEQIEASKTFKQLYQFEDEQVRGKTYHRYSNNCFDIIIDTVMFLNANVQPETIKKMYHSKSQQIAFFWGS